MTLLHRIVGFCRFARQSGLKVGVQETQDALRAARAGALCDRQTFRLALRALLCTSHSEAARFDALFESYWADQSSFPAVPQRSRKASAPDPLGRVRRAAQSISVGVGSSAAAEEEGSQTSGASAAERLRRTDFSKLAPQDQQTLEELALRLWKSMSLRLSRRLKIDGVKRRVDLRRTIRRNLSRGCRPFELAHRGRKQRRPRLVALLDVSGSMDQYSLLLLRFLHALEKHFRSVDSYLFSTRLTPVSTAMRRRPLQETLQAVSRAETAWSSGTRIGECLQEFNSRHARQTLSRGTLVLLLSDGLDTGPPEMLSAELEKISRRARKVVWLNPLLGMEGYSPSARGMSAAMPWIDIFAAAHNLESLLELESHLRM